ncbi:MAG: ribosome biogenesis GTP-binding protein YihA/YsxC [Pseudomonadota bacterium]
MASPNYKNATFLLSAAKLTQLPHDSGIEVAFVGRSNAGKSSVLNQLTNNAKLARVSKTPGRTQHINLFGLDDKRRLVDLPGYGFAKVPEEVKINWQKTLDKYLSTRECLRGLILVMDIRHPLLEIDRNLLDWASAGGLAVHILLNKADKLSYSATKATLLTVNEYISSFPNEISCQAFSATKKTGIKELREIVDAWFNGKILNSPPC